MPVDPWGYEEDRYFRSQGPTPVMFEDPWQTLISQSIEAARQVASIHEGGYPPGSTVVYSPTTQLPGQPQTTQLSSQGGSPQGIQLSQTTLMLLVGGVLLFMLGGRRK